MLTVLQLPNIYFPILMQQKIFGHHVTIFNCVKGSETVNQFSAQLFHNDLLLQKALFYPSL